VSSLYHSPSGPFGLSPCFYWGIGDPRPPFATLCLCLGRGACRWGLRPGLLKVCRTAPNVPFPPPGPFCWPSVFCVTCLDTLPLPPATTLLFSLLLRSAFLPDLLEEFGILPAFFFF